MGQGAGDSFECLGAVEKETGGYLLRSRWLSWDSEPQIPSPTIPLQDSRHNPNVACLQVMGPPSANPQAPLEVHLVVLSFPPMATETKRSPTLSDSP